jgi:hypothetical protein
MPFDPLFCKPLQPFAFELIILVCTVASRTLSKLLGGHGSVHTNFAAEFELYHDGFVPDPKGISGRQVVASPPGIELGYAV